MKRLIPALLIALAAGACDNPSGLDNRVETVTVLPEAQNVGVGETVQLSAQARDEQSVVIAQVQFEWSSLEPAVATVAQTGLVTGVSTGTARIVASANGKADTARVTVFGTAAQCGNAGAGLNLSVGQSVQRQGAAGGVLCLEGGTAGAEFTIIPFNAATGGTVSLRAEPAGVTAAAGPPNPSRAPFSISAAFTQGAAEGPDAGFHARLNERARDVLAPRVAAARRAFAAGRTGGARFQTTPTAPTVGTLLALNVETDGHPCTATDYRTGRVVAVSQRAVVVADTANPAGGLTDTDYQHVAATFDTLVYPVNAAAFGEPADVDRNGRVVIFYTRAVNELTPANVNYVVGGFFYGRDLFPKQNDPNFGGACTGSNYAEMFYLLAPDPSGVVNGNVRTTESVLRSTVGVVGHEFQHLISASRRLYIVPDVSGTSWNEEVWLNEGLSHIAEELLFYRRSGLAPRGNHGASILAAGSRPRAAFIEFGQQNYARYGEYLRNPETSSPYKDDDDLGTRGAAWAFLRYVADQRSGSETDLWMRLVNNNRVGLNNLSWATGQDAVLLARDFTVSVYTDDAVPGVPAIFTQPSWNHRSLFQTINSGGFPLLTRPLATASPADVSLTAGGAAYLRTAVAAGRRGSVLVTSNGGPLPGEVWVTVVRTK